MVSRFLEAFSFCASNKNRKRCFYFFILSDYTFLFYLLCKLIELFKSDCCFELFVEEVFMKNECVQ